MPLGTADNWWHGGSCWGDAFAEDGWLDMAAVDRWDAVHPDEALRLFPRLVPRDETVSAATLDRLDAALQATAGEASERGWLGSGSRARSERPGDQQRLALIALARRLRAGERLAYDETLAQAVAFRLGFHPGYLWAHAASVHEWATATGWLGVLARGRRAWLPLDIAESLAGAIERRPAELGRPTDSRYEPCGFEPAQWGALARAAHRRLEGKVEPVRLRAAKAPRMLRLGHLRRPLPITAAAQP